MIWLLFFGTVAFLIAREAGAAIAENDAAMQGIDIGSEIANLGGIAPPNFASEPIDYAGNEENMALIIDPRAKPFLQFYQDASAKYGVPLAILLAQGKQESGYDPNARSIAGAYGIAQFMPATAKQYGVNRLSPESSIDGQARMMRDLYAKFGRWDLALQAYNGGSGNLSSWLRTGKWPTRNGPAMPLETRNYSAVILADANQSVGQERFV